MISASQCVRTAIRLNVTSTTTRIMDGVFSIYRGVIAGIGFLIVIAFISRRTRAHPQEPPYVKPRIPLVGHLIGVLWYGYDYYPMMASVPIRIVKIGLGRLMMKQKTC